MKKITLSIFPLLFGATLAAQTTDPDTIFTRDVDIVREYTPKIKDAGKINTLPQIEAVENPKPDVQYLTWSAPLASPQFDLQRLPAATLRKIRQQRMLREGYARIGAGNYTSFLGDVYVPIVRKNDLTFDVLFRHLSSFGKVKLENDEKVRARNMNNSLSLGLDKNFVPFSVSFDVDFTRNDFNYYGLDNLSDFNPAEHESAFARPAHNRDAHNMFDVKVGIESNPRIASLNYDASAAYHLTKTYTGIAENIIALEGGVYSLRETSDFGAQLSLENMFYNTPKQTAALWNDNKGDETDTYSILKIMPFYKFKRDFWHLKIGTKLNISFNNGRVFAIAPDIDAKVTIVEDIFYLYGNITGDLQNGSLRNTFAENRYFSPDLHVKNTYIPLDITAGVKTKIYRDLIFNASVEYKMMKDAHLFDNRHRNDSICDNLFSFTSDDVNMFRAGGAFTYNYQNKAEIIIEGNYLKWNTDKQAEAWNLPNWKLDLGATYHVTDDIHLTLNSFMYGRRYALAADGTGKKMEAVFDINLEGVYELKSWIAFWAKLNNIISENYQLWYGYNSQRFNFMAGVTFSF